MRPLAIGLAALALCAASPARAELALKHTRLLDVTLGSEPAAAPEPAPVRRSLAWALIPFGVGQFANDSPVKGGLFCASELLAFGTFAASLGAFEANKTSGSFLGGGTFQDTGLASVLQTTYLIAFWSGVALAIVGVVEALISRPPESETVALGPGALAIRF